MSPTLRDAAFEGVVGIANGAGASPGHELIGNIASGVAAIVHAVHEIPIAADDVFVDLGAGDGKVAALVNLLTGARVRGLEMQAEVVTRARERIAALGLEDVEMIHGDARVAIPDDGTVFYLYLPCTGGALAAVMQRVHEVAQR